MMSTTEHRQAAKNQSATCAVLTISDTRTEETDTGGKILREALAAAVHSVLDYTIVKDEPDAIESQLRAYLNDRQSPDVICTTGGTGIASRDTTIEVVSRLN